MKGRAFLLGVWSLCAQVLLLREVTASFGGSELLIGTSLAGWLGAVGLGAWLAGSERFRMTSLALFLITAVVLPLELIIIRLSPLFFIDAVIEVTPFLSAALASIVLLAPVGLLSGLLFTAISREGWRPADSIARVYLWEGLGAFAGGIMCVALLGKFLSGTTMALSVSAVVLVQVGTMRYRQTVPRMLGSLLLVGMIFMLVHHYQNPIEHKLDQIRYVPLQVQTAFDTPYGHQTIVRRDSALILLTDGRTEATYPDQLAAEEILIPVALYKPQPEQVLYVGRGEFGLDIARQILPGTIITCLDNRIRLGHILDSMIGSAPRIVRLSGDAMQYLGSLETANQYDAIVIRPGLPESYLAARMLSSTFMGAARRALTPDGILIIITEYDTDRYVSMATARQLSTITGAMKSEFKRVWNWPGANTVSFGSSSEADLPSFETLFERMDTMAEDSLRYGPDILEDRLQNYKIQRVEAAIEAISPTHSLVRPQLVKRQLLTNAEADGTASIVRLMIDNPIWPAALVLFIVVSFVTFIKRSDSRPKAFGLVLLFIAGLVSLSLELLSFYIYQTLAGHLIEHLAVLIGCFMLGLSAGSYFAMRAKARKLEYPSLLVLILCSILFGLTFTSVDHQVLLLYHSMFLLIVALATGSLFVAATRRLMRDEVLGNRGRGYAVEITGSAIGAILTTMVLLPMIGLYGILFVLCAILVLGFLGAARTERC